MRLKRSLPVALAATLQLMPMLRVAQPAQFVAASPAWAFVLRLAAGTVALLGSHHAVSGATTIVAPYTVNGTNGVHYARQLGLSGRVPGSWSASTATKGSAVFPLTPGLWLTNTTGRIGGTPSGTGTSNITISVWEFGGNTGPTISQVFVFTIAAATGPPGISTQPVGQTNIAGTNVTFSVGAFGSQPLTYQWRQDGAGIASATDSSFTRTNLQADDAGNYSVVVANSLGSITSSTATLVVRTPPSITTQPTNLTAIKGMPAKFSVAATSFSLPVYQWRFNGTNLPQGTSATLTIPATLPSNAGDYSVAIHNSVGTTISSNATLTVVLAPSIATLPFNLTVNAGSPASFKETTFGTAPLVFQWFKDGNIIPGATTNAIALASAQPGDAGSYTLVVTNSYGSATGGPVVLTVIPPPAVTLQPAIQGSILVVSFNALVGTNYVVQTAATPGAWTTLTNIAATVTNMVFSDSLTNSQRFYRVSQ